MADYFASVQAKIRNAQRIFILGPGETKHQLKTYLTRSKDMAGNVIMVETADSLRGSKEPSKSRSATPIV